MKARTANYHDMLPLRAALLQPLTQEQLPQLSRRLVHPKLSCDAGRRPWSSTRGFTIASTAAAWQPASRGGAHAAVQRITAARLTYLHSVLPLLMSSITGVKG